MSDGIEEALRALVADGREWVTTGQVTGFTEHAELGFLVDFTYVEDGREGQARLATLAAGPRAGVFAPVAAGDEVLILQPDGAPNQAIALPLGLMAATRARPESWSNDSVQVIHPQGLTVRSEDEAPVQGVPRGDDLRAALDSFFDALSAFMATATGSSDPTVAAAAGAWMADPAVSGFKTALQAAITDTLQTE